MSKNMVLRVKANYLVQGKELGQVSDFSYLRPIISEFGKLDRELVKQGSSVVSWTRLFLARKH